MTKTIVGSDTKRALLNAVAGEVIEPGGDFAYYRTLNALSDHQLEFVFLPERFAVPPRLVRVARKAADKTVRHLEPPALRRTAFLGSRFAPISRRLVQSLQPAAVLSHLWFPAIPGGIQVPVIWTSQGLGPPEYYATVNRWRRSYEDVLWLYRRLGSRATFVVSWTSSGARRLRRACPDLAARVKVIHPPLPAGAALPAHCVKASAADGVMRLLFVGGDYVRKGGPDLVPAFRRARVKSAMTLTIVTGLRGAALREVEDEPGVVALPYLSHDQILRLMADADVLVLPSHNETYGLVVAEAMALGCAVIVSDAEPLPEVAGAPDVGFVVPREEPALLAEAMLLLAGDEGELRRRQSAAQAFVWARQGPDSVRKQFLGLLDEL